jgi:hypothetical protein
MRRNFRDAIETRRLPITLCVNFQRQGARKITHRTIISICRSGLAGYAEFGWAATIVGVIDEAALTLDQFVQQAVDRICHSCRSFILGARLEDRKIPIPQAESRRHIFAWRFSRQRHLYFGTGRKAPEGRCA